MYKKKYYTTMYIFVLRLAIRKGMPSNRSAVSWVLKGHPCGSQFRKTYYMIFISINDPHLRFTYSPIAHTILKPEI